MTCLGQLHRGESYLLADLRLDPAAAEREHDFHLHPAKMDASTLVAFGRDEAVGTEPFIPFHIGSVRPPHRLRSRPYPPLPAPAGRVYDDAGVPGQRWASGGRLLNDYTLPDEAGSCLVGVRRMACKRIRPPALITRLLAEVDADRPPAAGVQRAAEGALDA